jgi:hypothetical protein
MRSLRLIHPQDDVLEAIRALYDKHPWSTTLEAQDLGSLIYDLRFLPYRPTLGDVYGAVEALSVEQGRDVAELTWDEVRQVFNLKLVSISGRASLRINARTVKVEE